MTKLRTLSLGAGVQSTTLALMAAHGEIGPMPDCAIFSDTGWEPRVVYDHLARLREALPFPVHVVSAGNLREDTLARSKTLATRVAAVPWFMRMPNGDEAMGRRQCTQEYKLRPLQRKAVELMGGKRPKGGCEMWIGISTDEAFRMRPSRVQYIANRWPLIELRMNRNDCERWMERNGWTAPKSSCIGCPFHSDEQWRALTPAEFADAIVVDRAIRRQPGMKGEQFMHRSLKPLEEVDLSTAEDRGQLNLFNNECEGMCGV
jgi:hypothetical protein